MRNPKLLQAVLICSGLLLLVNYSNADSCAGLHSSIETECRDKCGESNYVQFLSTIF